MPVTVVIGAQWGDEGKGKIVDYLAQEMDMVVRFNGGPNAGRTVYYNGMEFILHMVPAGIFNPEVICVMGNGMVIKPNALIAEINMLQERGISCAKLRISDKAHLIMSEHLLRDKEEESLRGAKEIGTTLQGIGPAYSDKASRRGIRMENLPDEYLDILGQYICQTEDVVHRALAEKKRILLEGAQGTMLDIDFGTYPHVTSSVCTTNGALQGSGVSWNAVTEVIGVVKAYATRVGSKAQPFETEMPEGTAGILREQAKEYGATTGRPRRIGWLDIPKLNYVARINGFTRLAITRMDNLGMLPEIKICHAYAEKNNPIYLSVPGKWGSVMDDQKAGLYLQLVEALTDIPIKYISYGPDRDQVIVK